MKKIFRYAVLVLVLSTMLEYDICYAAVGDEGNICRSGYHDFGDKYLSVNNKKKGSKPCYVYGDFGTKESRVLAGINAWNSRINQYGTQNKVSLAKTPDKTTAKIHIKKAYLGVSVGGLTHFFVGNKEIFATPGLSQNYDFVTIQLNTDILSNSDASKVTAHESGHALGLSHRLKDKKSIMHNFYDKTEVGVPSKTDVITLMHVYQ